MIKDFKQMAEGTEIKGLPLMIKTARKTFQDAEGIIWQEVVFMDGSGEITGHIQLDADNGSVPWQSKTNLCIMGATLQTTDERKKESMKLVVTECFDTATPLSYDQRQELQEQDWKKIREDEIRGKVRHWVTSHLFRQEWAYLLEKKI